MKICCDTLTEFNQWRKDAVYVIGIMARRDAYFTEWDVSDIVGPPPKGCSLTVDTLLTEAELAKHIRRVDAKDILVGGDVRTIWLGVK